MSAAPAPSPWDFGMTCEVGPSHLARGRECQDYASVRSDGSTLSAVVCDGAGSLKFSAAGAAAVAEHLAEFMLMNAPEVVSGEVLAGTILNVIRQRVRGVARDLGAPVGELGCTATALLIHDGRFATWTVGDSMAFALVRDIPTPITQAQVAEGGSTWFVTSAEAAPVLRVHELPRHLTGFFLATDGAESLWRKGVNSPSAYIASIVSELDMNDPLGLKQAVRGRIMPVTDDDTTVVAIRRRAISGVYGCPRCGGEEIRTRENHARDLLLRKCLGCDELVLRWRGAEEARALEAGYYAELRRECSGES